MYYAVCGGCLSCWYTTFLTLRNPTPAQSLVLRAEPGAAHRLLVVHILFIDPKPFLVYFAAQVYFFIYLYSTR